MVSLIIGRTNLCRFTQPSCVKDVKEGRPCKKKIFFFKDSRCNERIKDVINSFVIETHYHMCQNAYMFIWILIQSHYYLRAKAGREMGF